MGQAVSGGVLLVWTGMAAACHKQEAPPAILPSTAPQADGFPGAAQLLERLRQLQPSSPPPAPGAPAPTQDPLRALATDLDAFPARAATLDPEAAAREWLALFGRQVRSRFLPGGDPALRQRLSPERLFDLMPGPASWPSLRRLAAEAAAAFPNPKQRQYFLLLADTLNNGEAAQWADLRVLGGDAPAGSSGKVPAFASSSPTPGPLIPWPEYCLLGSRLSLSAGNADELEHFWQRIAAPPQGETVDGSFSQATLPDFVAILGKERAAALLRSLLLSCPVSFQKVQGEETRLLAAKIALESVDKLPSAPWCLTHGIETPALYAALVRKYGAPRNDPDATAWYVLAQVVAGHPDVAVAAARELPDYGRYQLERTLGEAAAAGRGAEVRDFLHALLVASPQTDVWEFYLQTATQTGQADAALAFVRQTAGRADLPPEARAAAGAVLYQALLAGDQVDDGLAALRAQIAAAPSDRATLQRRVRGWLDLAAAGRALKRDAVEQEGIAGALALLSSDVRSDIAPDHADAVHGAVDYLMGTGRDREAARLQSDELVRLVGARLKSQAGQDAFRNFANPYADGTREIQAGLVSLATLYDRAGRSADVVALLEGVPYWGVRDLLDVAQEKVYFYRREMPSLGLLAARALAAQGRTAEARTVLDHALRVDGGNDAAYALLLQLHAGEGDVGDRLDALFRQDQFQERPLVWKASWLLDRGRVADAEAACKQAISIDPSDGEEGKGDRMRAYAVMARICDAKHDDAQAGLYRNIVEAIRMSEDADDLYDAHLLTRAVALYQQALGKFSDAYCIQSRIARQLAALGRLDEAAPHYRRAFELMPSSFGRMESHCFGCERAFEGKTAVQLAEETFQAMIAKDPRNPRLPYLQGYLRYEEGRYPEALDGFRRATELDPDYLNAWKKITEVNEHVRVPAALFDRAVLNLLRLDPARRHIYFRAEQVRDLPGLWTAVETANKAVPPPPVRLLPLPAAVREGDARLADAKAARPGIDFDTMRTRFPRRADAERKSPSAVLRDNELVQAAENGLR